VRARETLNCCSFQIKGNLLESTCHESHVHPPADGVVNLGDIPRLGELVAGSSGGYVVGANSMLGVVHFRPITSFCVLIAKAGPLHWPQ